MKVTRNTVAVITGGASGLGAATAVALASRGANVYILDNDSVRGLKIAKKVKGHFFQLDVSVAEEVREIMDLIHEASTSLHILVNCAGIGPAGKTLSRGEPHDPKVFSKVININLLGSFFCATYAAERMLKNNCSNAEEERGVIINTASIAAYEGQIGQVAYSASKGGIVGMTLPMARDLSAHGIRVCTIAPGLFQTPLLEGLPENVKISLGKQVPFPPRLGKPDEYANLACHIVENEMLNGEVIRLDGAMRMSAK